LSLSYNPNSAGSTDSLKTNRHSIARFDAMRNVRSDFPFLGREINRKPIAYLDNAATTQKPRQVIERVCGLYSSGIANVHRAVNSLADEVTEAFEGARSRIAGFIGAQSREVIFVGNATQGVNLVCGSLSRHNHLRVVTTTLEHHSNFLPWTEHSAVIFLPWAEDGTIDLAGLSEALAQKPALVAISAASNFLGAIQPIRELVERCHAANVPVLVDASQTIAHQRYDVHELECDYLVFSGHKMYGPSGIGILYARDEWIEKMTPLLLGGNMVKEVHASSWVPNDIPHRFEAGTPNIEGVIGLAAAIEYLESLDWDELVGHECSLTQHAKRGLGTINGVRLFGPSAEQASAPLVSFQVKGLDSGAVAKVLGQRGNVIVRSGFLCAQPAHDRLRLGPSVRASFGVYNTKEEVDQLLEIVQSLARIA
jgi:cysteine desulfurase/selenocysteine lyase